MKKLIFGLLPLFALFLMATPVNATEVEMCIDEEGYYETGEWIEDTYSCPDGYEEYEDGDMACRLYVEDIVKEYKNPTCPILYHLQTAQSWNQRCHRDFHWLQPEYKSPTCSNGYSQDELTCSKTTDNSYYEYSAEVSNEDGHYGEDKWIEPTYKGCDKEPEVVVEVKKEKKKVFHTLKGCYEPKPETPQWAIKLPANGGIKALWSAMGGEKVDIEVTNSKGEWEYLYHNLTNDGHEFLPNVTMSQDYRVRVIRVCTESDWLIDP